MRKPLKRTQTPSRDDGFGFIKKDNGIQTPSDIENTTRLHDAVRSFLGPSHYLIRKSRKSKWATHIRMLRTVDGHTDEHITTVMKWYVDHMGEEYIPAVYSATSFREKFHKIEAAMARDVLNTAPHHPDADTVVESLEMLGWPKGAQEGLQGAVSASLAVYAGWRAEIVDYLRRIIDGDLRYEYGSEYKSLFGLADHVIKTIPAPAYFVDQWFIGVYDRVSGWDAWDGDLRMFIFKPDSKRFRAMLVGWCEEYTGNVNSWKRLEEVLMNESE